MGEDAGATTGGVKFEPQQPCYWNGLLLYLSKSNQAALVIQAGVDDLERASAVVYQGAIIAA